MKVSSPPPTIMQQNKKGNTSLSSRAQDQGVPAVCLCRDLLEGPGLGVGMRGVGG